MLTANPLRIEDLPRLAGQVVESPYVVIDDRLRALFEQSTMIDEFLTDEERALYPDGLLEGFHLVGLLDHFVSKYVPWDRSTYGLNYGLDRVRFVSPMTSLRPLRFRATVTQVVPRHRGFLVYFDCLLEHAGAERPGMTATWICYQLPVDDGDVDRRNAER